MKNVNLWKLDATTNESMLVGAHNNYILKGKVGEHLKGTTPSFGLSETIETSTLCSANRVGDDTLVFSTRNGSLYTFKKSTMIDMDKFREYLKGYKGINRDGIGKDYGYMYCTANPHIDLEIRVYASSDGSKSMPGIVWLLRDGVQQYSFDACMFEETMLLFDLIKEHGDVTEDIIKQNFSHVYEYASDEFIC